MTTDMPEGWKDISLSEIASESKVRWTPTENTIFNYVGLEHIEQGTGTLKCTGSSSDISSQKTKFTRNDILFGKLRPNLRKVVQVPFDGVCSTDILAIRVNKKATTGFLFHSLLWQRTIDYAVRSAAGTKMPRTSWKLMAQMPLELPPLEEQMQIAVVLSSVDEAIRATQAVIEQNRSVKKGLLQTLLTQGIGHTKFKPSALGDIPETWKVVTLQDIASVERGKFSIRPRNDPRYFGGDFPFVQTGDVVAADGLLTQHTQTLNDDGLSVSRCFPSGSILVTIAANIGDTAVTTYPVCCPDSLVAVQALDGINLWWLHHYLSAQKTYLESVATQNAQKNINLTHLRPLPILLPPSDEQIRIADVLNSVRDATNEEEQKLTQLKTLKSGLMSDLLTGRVRTTKEVA